LGATHVPHSTLPPQPSLCEPQLTPSSAHVFGVQPHLLATPPPPQVFGSVHVPQSSALLQPSLRKPHSAPRLVHVCGVHVPVPHLLTPPPPQV
jgi:hypothetical protein